MYFTNKVLWITGASSGIGKALAIEFSRQNCKLILSSRNKEALECVKIECENPKNIVVIPLDLENYTSLKQKTAEAILAFGKIDILINNGGVSQRSLVENTQIEVDKRIMDINYLGTLVLLKAILPHFIENKLG